MRITVAAIALLLTVTSCTGSDWALADPSGPRPTTPSIGFDVDLDPSQTVVQAVPAALRSAASCDALLDHIKEEALSRVGPWGLEPAGGPWWGGPMPLEGVAIAAPETTAAGAVADRIDQAEAPLPGVDYSATNTQEVGVDEFDIVKTDGRRILAIVNGEEVWYETVDGGYYGSGPVLVHLTVGSDGAPQVTGRLPLGRGWGHTMVLAGDSVFIVSEGSRPAVATKPAPNVWEGDYLMPYSSVTLVSQVDISDPGDMRVVRDLYVDGSFVAGRLADGLGRIVLRSQPTGLAFVTPAGAGLRAEREAEEENRRIVAESTIDNWLPYYVLEDHDAGTAVEGALLDCEDVYLPEASTGLGLTYVLTIDTRDGLSPSGGKAAIFTAGETVYATATSLYVATAEQVEAAEVERLRPQALAELATTIHKFDLAPDGGVAYAASGAVPGYLLNQWAMSEHDGVLRVASTDAGSFWGIGDSSQSFVTTLAATDGELVALGQVGDLGRGERIYAVRYQGELGFVVTFRQVDPLYVIDLSDPAAPRRRGELKIPGYSSYLHPVGEGRLLGIGQDATDQGVTLGTQVSLFDVTDLDHPLRLDKLTLGEGSSEAEYDHRAFLFWAPSGLAVLPIERWHHDGRGDHYFSGAVGVAVAGDGIREAGTVSHQASADVWEYGTQIRRSLVIGDVLYTVADGSVRAWRLDGLAFLAAVDLAG